MARRHVQFPLMPEHWRWLEFQKVEEPNTRRYYRIELVQTSDGWSVMTYRSRIGQKPRPMMVMGTFSPAGMDRAARLTDGFNPVALPDLGFLEQYMRGAKQAWQNAGREGQPEMIVRVNHGFISDTPLGQDRLFLTGSVEQVRGDVQKLADLGATEVFFSHLTAFGNAPDGFEQLMKQARLTRGVV